MKIKFTEKSINSLIPEAKPYEAIDIQLPGFLVRVQPTGRLTYYYSYKSNTRKRVRLKLGRHGVITLTQAREMAKAAAGDIAKGKDPQAEKQLQRERAIRNEAMTLGVFIKDHYESWVLKHNKRGDSNIYVVHRYFPNLINRPIDSITAAEIEKWQAEELTRTNKQGSPIKPATINRNLTCMRAVFARAIATKYIDKNPLDDVKNIKQEDDEIIRYLSKSEEERLYNALRDRHNDLAAARTSANDWRSVRGHDLYPEFTNAKFVDHIEPMVLLAINTGLRKGEIFCLKWQDVNFEQKIITVRAANAKSRKVRHVNLNRRALEVITDWSKQQSPCSGWVFKNRSGNRFVDIKKAWQAVLVSAGITDFRFHDLRHHFASKLVMLGVPLNTIRELLGHSDLATTLRYAHLAQDHKAEAVELLAN